MRCQRACCCSEAQVVVCAVRTLQGCFMMQNLPLRGDHETKTRSKQQDNAVLALWRLCGFSLA